MIYERSREKQDRGDTRPVLFIDDRLCSRLFKAKRLKLTVSAEGLCDRISFEGGARNGARGDCIPEYEKVCRE